MTVPRAARATNGDGRYPCSRCGARVTLDDLVEHVEDHARRLFPGHDRMVGITALAIDLDPETLAALAALLTDDHHRQ